jgi:hypothetical protein
LVAPPTYSAGSDRRRQRRRPACGILLTNDYEWTRICAAAAIWDIEGQPQQAPVVVDIVLQAWQENPATGTYVAACFKRLGPAARPAIPQIRAELGRPERAGWLANIDDDERLLRDLTELLNSIDAGDSAAPVSR